MCALVTVIVHSSKTGVQTPLILIDSIGNHEIREHTTSEYTWRQAIKGTGITVNEGLQAERRQPA